MTDHVTLAVAHKNTSLLIVVLCFVYSGFSLTFEFEHLKGTDIYTALLVQNI